MKKGILAFIALVGVFGAISLIASPAVAYEGTPDAEREALVTEWMTTCDESSYEAWRADRDGKGVLRKVDSFEKFQTFCKYWEANESGDEESAQTYADQLTLGQKLENGTGLGNGLGNGISGSSDGTGNRSGQNGLETGPKGDGTCDQIQ